MKPGQLVTLRSGSPVMTIVAVSRSGDVYKCVYAEAAGVLQETRWLPAAVLCEVSWCVTYAGAKPAAMTSAADAVTCPDCRHSQGSHRFNCPRFPKKGNHACRECGWYNGLHSASCQSRGYSAVGQHPDSPDRTPDTVRLPARGPCPCGIDRRDCEYHR